MVNRIKTALRELNIQEWTLIQDQESSCELFFVGKQLDMRRLKAAESLSLTVYRVFDKDRKAFRGSAAVQLFANMETEELKKIIEDAYGAAAFVQNPYYELYEGQKAECITLPSRLGEQSLEDSALQLAEALYRADNSSTAFINSAELFVLRNQRNIFASTGTQVSFVKYSCNGEFVVQSQEPQDVEQYFSFRYEDLETEELYKKAKQALMTVYDRARAIKTPVGGIYDLILSGEHVATLLSLYAARANASMIYPKYSDWKPGTMVQGEEVKGERLNMSLLPSAPYSGEGIPMKERALLKAGELQCIYGSNRYCRYLEVEPTGDYRRIKLANGSVALEQLKQGCLYPVSFSDFQMDPMTGHFGGEIRLAYLYTKEGVQLLTGGSVNGSLFEKQGELSFSLETYKDASYEGPFAICIPKVNVSGC